MNKSHFIVPLLCRSTLERASEREHGKTEVFSAKLRLLFPPFESMNGCECWGCGDGKMRRLREGRQRASDDKGRKILVAHEKLVPLL